MKHFMKVSLMALVAMFAFNTTADAQLGGLLKKAKSAVMGTSSQDAYWEQQKKYDKMAKEQAAKNAAEDAEREARLKEVEVKSWKTGKMEKVANPFIINNKLASPETTAQIYAKEKNFSDKDSKKKIIEQFLDDEKFNNRKRGANDVLKDRKVVEIVFLDDSWSINRTNMGDIKSRTMEFYAISEMTNGFTVCDRYYANNTYAGGGNYEVNIRFSLKETYHSGSSDGQYRWFVVDWEHKDNADPLAGL